MLVRLPLTGLFFPRVVTIGPEHSSDAQQRSEVLSLLKRGNGGKENKAIATYRFNCETCMPVLYERGGGAYDDPRKERRLLVFPSAIERYYCAYLTIFLDELP
jgi:hypothetical protein